MLSLLTMVGRLISTENPVVCIHFLFPLSIISLIFSVHQFGKGGIFLAEEGVPGLEGSPGGNLRRSAGHGGFSIPRARGSISGNQRRADPSLRGSGYEYAASTAPGGEVMLNDFNCSCPIYIACGYTDLRRGIDGLASIVQSVSAGPLSENVVPVLRQKTRPHQGIVLGRRRISLAV